MFLLYGEDIDVWNDSGFSGIIDAVCDGVHLPEYLIMGNPDDLPCPVFYSEYKLASLAVCKRHGRLEVLLLVFRNVFLEFNRLTFSLFDFRQNALGVFINACPRRFSASF